MALTPSVAARYAERRSAPQDPANGTPACGLGGRLPITLPAMHLLTSTPDRPTALSMRPESNIFVGEPCVERESLSPSTVTATLAVRAIRNTLGGCGATVASLWRLDAIQGSKTPHSRTAPSESKDAHWSQPRPMVH